MNRETLIEQINQVMIEGFELEPSQLQPQAQIIEDLELDSLDAIDMLVFLEEKIKIKVDAETFRTVKTLDDVYNVVENVVKESDN
ncbi:MAG: acyl carrier protein [Pseudomonadota bacterium]